MREFLSSNCPDDMAALETTVSINGIIQDKACVYSGSGSYNHLQFLIFRGNTYLPQISTYTSSIFIFSTHFTYHIAYGKPL